MLVVALVTAVLVTVRLSADEDQPLSSTVRDLAGEAAADAGSPTSPEPTSVADSVSGVRQAVLAQERPRQKKLEKQRKADALARKAAREAKRAAREAEKARTAPFDVKIGTFNVLGSQHTAPRAATGRTSRPRRPARRTRPA